MKAGYQSNRKFLGNVRKAHPNEISSQCLISFLANSFPERKCPLQACRIDALTNTRCYLCKERSNKIFSECVNECMCILGIVLTLLPAWLLWRLTAASTFFRTDFCLHGASAKFRANFKPCRTLWAQPPHLKSP